MKISDFSRVHFIGIGGIGMSALARLFLHEKKLVSGSNRETSAITDSLIEEGVTFFATQVASNITTDIELVVYTEAMAPDQEEMVAARALEVKMVNYFEALGMVANDYYLVAVAGSHGKTTTTAMLADILEEASYDPTVIVGSLRSKTGSNYRPGKSKYAVVEACEYRRDFLYLKPNVLVITNVEYEHVDYYKDLADVQDAFRTLALSVPYDGFIIADTSDLSIVPIIKEVEATVIDYRSFLNLELPLHQPGLHNRLNAAAAAAAASSIGIEAEATNRALENFSGTWRRFEYKGTFLAGDRGAIPVFDDYAHHPTEIAASIAGAREQYPGRHLTVVFQSHTYSRTHALFADFVNALAKADTVYLLPIYGAREENTFQVTSEQISAALQKKKLKAEVLQTNGGAALRVKETVPQGGIVVVMGAGDVTQVASELTS